MDRLLKDIRYGLRGFLKHPGFTALVIVTLALGIGASTAIFSVVNTVLLRPLPYAQAERIIAIHEVDQKGKRGQVTPANFLDWRAQNTVFEHLAAILTRPANLASGDQAERVELAMTSANFFSVFGIEPVRGRLFIASDEQAGHVVWEAAPEIDAPRDEVAVANFMDWKTQNQVFDDMAALSFRSFNITGDGEPEKAWRCWPAICQRGAPRKSIP